jgi:hypothetical protein
MTDLNLLGQLRVTYAMDLNDRWQFFAGPVANIHITRGNENETVDIAPYEMFRFTGRNTENVKILFQKVITINDFNF